MNLLALSFDHALLDPQSGAHSESRRRQLAYAQELSRRVPGSCIRIAVRSRPGLKAQPLPIAEGLELFSTPSSTVGFIAMAYRYGRSLCSQRGLDLVTSQSPFVDGLVACLLQRRCEVKWLAQLHLSTLDNPYWLQERAANRLRAWFGRRMLQYADAVRVVSRSASSWLQQQLHIPEDRIFVIPVGTGLSADNSLGPPAQGSGNTVLFVGRLSPEKGLFTLLHAFARIKAVNSAARLCVVGDGPLKAGLKELSESLQLQDRVQFQGWIPYEQLPELYESADVVVVPSLHESYGRVIVEAMSFGRPVVATDTQGARELVQDGRTGRIVPVRDVAALAEAISELLGHPQLATEMGQAARAYVQQMLDPRALCAAQVEMWLKVAAG